MHRANNFTLASPRSPRKPASPRVKRDEAAAAAARAVYEATSEAPTTLFESSRIDDHDFNELLRENKMLDQRNQTLSHRVDDHEAIVKRMWRRGWAEAPSPRGLRELTTTTVAAAAHERHEADAARELAQRHLREAMRAKADADVAHNHANHASAELEMERERMREWHAGDAQDLTRRMTEMTRAFAAEQVKNATLTHDAERSSEERAAAIGGLVAQLEGSRESQRELARRARAENGELARRLEESTRALEECRMGAYEERRRLEEASGLESRAGRTEGIPSDAFPTPSDSLRCLPNFLRTPSDSFPSSSVPLPMPSSLPSTPSDPFSDSAARLAPGQRTTWSRRAKRRRRASRWPSSTTR